MNKKKRIIGIGSLFVVLVIVIIVVAVKSKKETDVENPNLRYIDTKLNVDNIEWIGVAEDGVSTCIVQYDSEPYYYSVVPGKYILYYSAKGSREFIKVHIDDRFKYDLFEIYRYDIITREEKKLFDVLSFMEERPEMQVTIEEYGCYIVEGQIVYQKVYELQSNEDIPYGQEIDKDYLCINVEDGSYTIQEEKTEKWETETTSIFYDLKDEKLLLNNLPEGMLEEIDSNVSFYAFPYKNFEGVFKVYGLAEYLPEHNEVLYGMFPELEQYRGEEDCYICLYIAGNPTAEELLRLFMEDGQEISFEGAVLPGEYSTDGEDHEIHSFEEYEQWYDEE